MLNHDLKPLRVVKTHYTEGGVRPLTSDVNLTSGSIVAREPLMNSLDAGADNIAFYEQFNKLVCEDDASGIVESDGLLDLSYATRRMSIPFVETTKGHFGRGIKGAGLRCRSNDPDFRNHEYPYLIVLTQDKRGTAAQIDLYDDGYASAYIPAFRTGHGTAVVFMGKNPEHDTFRTPPYVEKVDNETWLVRDLNGRFAEAPNVRVTAKLYSGGTVRITGLLDILRRDGAESHPGRVGDYKAEFILLPYKNGKPTPMKHTKEKTNWSAIDRSLGGLIFLRDGDELYEWQDKSVSTPVELIGFDQPGKRRLMIVVDVTGTDFRPDSTRTRMSNPHNPRPFPMDVHKTAPKVVKKTMQEGAEIATKQSVLRSVGRFVESVVRKYGDQYFKDRNGELRKMEKAQTDTKTKVNIFTPEGEGPWTGPYAPNSDDPMPKVEIPGESSSDTLIPTKDDVKRTRASQKAGVPKVIFQTVDVPDEPKSLRVVSDKSGVVTVELNLSGAAISRNRKSPELSGLSKEILGAMLVERVWLTDQIYGMLFHKDEPTTGQDVSYLLENVSGVIDATRDRNGKAAAAGN